jgi:hypothetical protein
MVDINLPPPKATPSTDDTVAQYSGGQYHASNQGTIDTSQVPGMTMQPIKSGDGGNLSVDTSSLKTFADNLDTIADVLGQARTRVDNLEPIRAGGSQFIEAQTLATTVGGSGGMKENYLASLHSLRNALMDTADKIRTLAGKYSSIEELNQKAGSDLQQLLGQANTDVQQFESAVQATQSSAGGGSAPAPVSSGGGTT